MDYLEEQKGEIEALESIYYGDVQVLSSEPQHKFSIPIKSETFNPETEEDGLACSLVFTYVTKYPEEAPLIEIEDCVNFEEGYEEELLSFMGKQIPENLGMVMIFTLVSSAQEWLNVKWDGVKKDRDEAEARKKYEEEEAERKRFEGTRVTVETFLNWKTKFEEDTGIAKRREAIEREGKKLTGRELFMTDNTLNESDLKFLDDVSVLQLQENVHVLIKNNEGRVVQDEKGDWLVMDIKQNLVFYISSTPEIMEFLNVMEPKKERELVEPEEQSAPTPSLCSKQTNSLGDAVKVDESLFQDLDDLDIEDDDEDDFNPNNFSDGDSSS